MGNRNDTRAGDAREKAAVGYRPLEDVEIRGYQPEATGEPEGKHPPTGGSSVQQPPSDESGKKK